MVDHQCRKYRRWRHGHRYCRPRARFLLTAGSASFPIVRFDVPWYVFQ
jgi:hypothetical protein